MMEDNLIQILETLGYPVIRQGSLGDDPYPDRFFTFWNTDSTDGSHYDNDAVSDISDFDVNFYSVDPAETYSVLNNARQLLKANGWIISGTGYDVISDEPSHTGRGINAIYLNYQQED